MTTTPAQRHEYQTINVTTEGRVATITIDRPHALNALNTAVLHDLTAAAELLDRDTAIGAIVVTGSAKAFAAGADIKEMADQDFVEMFLADYFAAWQRFAAVKTPTVAAVAGYALGGGCELALMCDVIIAADTAVFGQPEIKLGVIAGMGGSQRLTRAIGKAKAMEMILTGRTMKATEAEAAGLVSRVVPADELLTSASQTAAAIAAMSLPAAVAAKEAVNRAYETTLSEGILFERRLFHSLFATHGQHEGMAAFIEKRNPEFNPT